MTVKIFIWKRVHLSHKTKQKPTNLEDITMKDLKITAEYKGHPIITGKQMEYAYNQRHLKNNLELMESMVERHNKVYSFRMDLRMPQNTELQSTPKEIARKFMSAFCKKNARNKIDTEYVMKMERETSDNEHFHIHTFVNGSKIQNHKKMVEYGEQLLASQLGLPKENNGLIEYSQIGKDCDEKNGIMIRLSTVTQNVPGPVD